MKEFAFSAFRIRTNNQPRPALCWQDLTAKEQREFDYSSAPEHCFIRYKGTVYDLSEFSNAVKPLAELGWEFAEPDSFFSGVVVRTCDDGEYVVAGTYFC